MQDILKAQSSVEERDIVSLKGDTLVVISNIEDVIALTGGMKVDSVGAYNGRGMMFALPSNDRRIVYLMNQQINFPSEVNMYYRILEKSGINPANLSIKVITRNGIVDYNDGLLAESVDSDGAWIDQVGKDIRSNLEFYFLHLYLTGEGKSQPVHTMMHTENMLHTTSEAWSNINVEFTSAMTDGMDKSVVRALIEQRGEGSLLSRAKVIFNRRKFEAAKVFHPDLDAGSYDILDYEEYEIDQLLNILCECVEQTLNEFGGFIVVKQAAGYSGGGNFFIKGDQLDDLQKAELKEFLLRGINLENPELTENLVIEQGYDLMRDPDGHIELGARGYIKKDGSIVITSIHRQLTTEIQGNVGGVYEGVNLANNAYHLSTNQYFAEAYQKTFESFKRLLDIFASIGYYGVVNLDFIINEDGEVFAVDLNNLREGGSTASSNMLALFTEIVNKNGGINMVPELASGVTFQENLGLWDKDYMLIGNSNLKQLNDAISELQSFGIYPYSTSTLHVHKLNVDGQEVRKIKLATPFDYNCFSNLEDQTRSDFLDKTIIRRANIILAKYGLSIMQAH